MFRETPCFPIFTHQNGIHDHLHIPSLLDKISVILSSLPLGYWVYTMKLISIKNNVQAVSPSTVYSVVSMASLNFQGHWENSTGYGSHSTVQSPKALAYKIDIREILSHVHCYDVSWDWYVSGFISYWNIFDFVHIWMVLSGYEHTQTHVRIYRPIHALIHASNRSHRHMSYQYWFCSQKIIS